MAEKTLASLNKLHSQKSEVFMSELNQFANQYGLQECGDSSRIWEYPWIWSHLKSYRGKNFRILDVGSEKGPFPWFLSTQGFKVTVSDVTAKYWRIWGKAKRQVRNPVRRRILDAQDLGLATSSYDAYLSVSVMEHIANKEKVIDEAARVLRPGGLLMMTFDICESEMGMSFPYWNGRALSMAEFDALFKSSKWFEGRLWEQSWNSDDIKDYLGWHRNTAPHHNYVTGAAILYRNKLPWTEPFRKEYLRRLLVRIRNRFSVPAWYTRKICMRLCFITGAFASRLIRKLLYLITSPYTAVFVGGLLFRLFGLRKRAVTFSLDNINSILVVRLDGIGDVVMTTPLLRELRRTFPFARIVLLVQPHILNIVALSPYVNEVHTYDCSAEGVLENVIRHGRALIMASRHLWQERFDLSIVPRWDIDGHHAGFVSYLSGAFWRLGYSEYVTEEKKLLNRGFNRLFTHVLNDPSLKHEVNRNLALISEVGGTPIEDSLEIWLSKEDNAYANRVLKAKDNIRNRKFIAFFPGAGEPKRKWPLRNFIELGLWLREHSIHIIVIGGKEDKDLGIELQNVIGDTVIDVTGKATLRQTSALLERCLIYVGNDAGPMHLAAAAGIPVIMISCHPSTGSPRHANSPKRFGPWGAGHHIVQPETPIPPCTDGCIASDAHCILRIDVGQVGKAIQDQLSINMNFHQNH